MTRLWKTLAGSVVLKVSGKDSRRYLNNRLSNDLRSLSPGASIAAAALTPQGKVEGLFTVLCEADDLFYLICDGGVRQAIFAAVGRYVVADRVSIEDLSLSAVVTHVSGPEADLRAEIETLGAQVTSRVFQSSISPLGIVVVVLDGAGESMEAAFAALWGKPLSAEELMRVRFSGGFPEYPTEVNDEVILTECGLLSAVSFSKGCYVGQEVIERSDAIGRLPRHLERISLSGCGSVQVGDAVLNREGTVIGKVVSSFCDATNERTFLFALLRSGKYAAHDAVLSGSLTGYVLSSEEKIP
jgi:folate-binding protein YgfZ